MPLRALAFNIWFYGLTLIMGLGGILVRIAARARTLDYARAWARLVLAGLRVLCGIEPRVTGMHHLRQGPALLGCQHQSAFDTLVWLTLLDAPSYVFKRELTDIPLFGPLLVPAGMIPVDRAAGATALRGLVTAARAAHRAGRQIVIFPEGTRVPPGQRVKLHPGIAAVAGQLRLPVVPVATNSGLHWGRNTLIKRPGPIHITIGPPIPPGTPRAELLDGVEAWWRHAEAADYLVDNSVGEAQIPRAARTARTPETYAES